MKAHLEQLVAYEHWANNQIIQLCQQVDELPPKVEAIFSHVFNAQHIWYSRLVGQQAELTPWMHADRKKWQAVNDLNTKLFQHFIEDLNGDSFTEPIHYTNTAGQEFSSSIQEILFHLNLHSSYHRGQLVVLLKPLVKAIPNTDFIFYTQTV